MSDDPVVIKEPLCAFCRHWMIGSLHLSTRMVAGSQGIRCTCHVKQPMKTTGIELCRDFGAAEMIQ